MRSCSEKHLEPNVAYSMKMDVNSSAAYDFNYITESLQVK